MGIGPRDKGAAKTGAPCTASHSFKSSPSGSRTARRRFPEPYNQPAHDSPLSGYGEIAHSDTHQGRLCVFTQLVLLRPLRYILAGLEGPRLATGTIGLSSVLHTILHEMLSHSPKKADIVHKTGVNRGLWCAGNRYKDEDESGGGSDGEGTQIGARSSDRGYGPDLISKWILL